MDQNGDDNMIPFAPGSPVERFFEQFGNLPNGMMQRHEILTGEGSGFFISPDGYAVTNNHVVDHAKSVQVTTDDGTSYTAKVIGTDPKTDLALIKTFAARFAQATMNRGATSQALAFSTVRTTSHTRRGQECNESFTHHRHVERFRHGCACK
jgi:S1-C subfamily serine protease